MLSKQIIHGIITLVKAIGMFHCGYLGELNKVENFSRTFVVTEINIAIVLTRFRHKIKFVIKLDSTTFVKYIYNLLLNNGIGISCLV